MIKNIGFKQFPVPSEIASGHQRRLLDLHLARLRTEGAGKKRKIHIVIGTRPELIKLAPLVYAFRRQPDDYEIKVIHTGQHIELVENLYKLFEIEPDYKCELLTKGQSLPALYSKAIDRLHALVAQDRPDLIIVQGDTTSAAAAALVGFLNIIPVAHVEAGLRTFDLYSPFPEELNRILIGQMAAFHFAPSQAAVDNLSRAGFPCSDIFLTGNTLIDSFHFVLDKVRDFQNRELDDFFKANEGRKKILLTLHRRENQDSQVDRIFQTIRESADECRGRAVVLFPVHLTPSIQEKAKKYFGDSENIKLCDPIEYFEFILVLKNSDFIVSDSGGIQEEAVVLRKPILILRDKTERMELVHSGLGELIGSDMELLKRRFRELLENTGDVAADNKILQSMPYGIGQASTQIVKIISDYFGNKLAASDYDLSIIVPCFNEEGNIVTIMDRLTEACERAGIKAEIIFVDDHSLDGTYAAGSRNAWKYTNVRVLTKTFPRGMGNAILFGLNHVRSDIVTVTMGDGSDDLSVLPLLYQKIKDENYDLAIASRYRQRKNTEHIPPIYRFFSGLYRLLTRHILGIPVKDITNAYRTFNWRVLKQIGLEGRGFEISPEITFKLWYCRRAVVEVDSKQQKRGFGQSKFSFLKAGPGYGKMMLKALIARFTKSWPYIDW